MQGWRRLFGKGAPAENVTVRRAAAGDAALTRICRTHPDTMLPFQKSETALPPALLSPYIPVVRAEPATQRRRNPAQPRPTLACRNTGIKKLKRAHQRATPRRALGLGERYHFSAHLPNVCDLLRSCAQDGAMGRVG
jgi:hypothetical protein